jgi:hypothetical protein
MNFDWELGVIWPGYLIAFCVDGQGGNDCESCRKFASLKGIKLNFYECPNYSFLKKPPEGDGYQLWENTTEGSPKSPVFSNIEELSEWCEKNASWYGDEKATKEMWLKSFRVKLGLAPAEEKIELCENCKFYFELKIAGLEKPQLICQKAYNHHYTTPKKKACEFYEKQEEQ